LTTSSQKLAVFRTLVTTKKSVASVPSHISHRLNSRHWLTQLTKQMGVAATIEAIAIATIVVIRTIPAAAVAAVPQTMEMRNNAPSTMCLANGSTLQMIAVLLP
jgi:hypothetical protein